MKRIIFTLFLLIPIFQAFSQGNFSPMEKTNKTLSGLIKQNTAKVSGDTIWLYHRYDIMKYSDTGYFSKYTEFLEYYDNSPNILSIMWIKYSKDTLYKDIYTYDDNNRIISTITQHAEEGKLVNYQKIDTYYGTNGYDSTYRYYLWNADDSTWQKNKLRGLVYDEYNHWLKDTTCVWNGQKWVLDNGWKSDYVLNELGSVLGSSTAFYNKFSKQWENNYRYDFYLTNDTTGEFNGYLIYAWINNQWENYQKFTDVVLHNWQGWNPKKMWEAESLIMLAWDGSSWYNVKRDTIVYYSNGGTQIRQYFWDWDKNKWYFAVRVNQFNNDSGFRIISSFEQWDKNNIKWDTMYADRYNYKYFRPYIWKLLHYERYDTATSKWIDAYDHICSDFSYILTTGIKDNKKEPQGMRIIPNPTGNNIQIKLKNKTAGIKTVKVYDMTGRLLLERNFDGNRRQVNVNVSFLKNAAYILTVRTDNGKVLKGKFIRN